MSLVEKIRGLFSTNRPQVTPDHVKLEHEERLREVQDRMYAITAEARAQRVIDERGLTGGNG